MLRYHGGWDILSYIDRIGHLRKKGIMMKMYRKKAARLAVLLSVAAGIAFPARAYAFEREEEVERYLGASMKRQMETEADEAAKHGEELVFWLAPLDEDGQTAEGVYGGIPYGSVFYSSIDQVWQPLGENTIYPSAIHQVGAKTGTVYISWNNGRGHLFSYTADQYEEIVDKVSCFKEEYIRGDMTDFEREMQIIQYLVENVTYPYGRYLAGQDTREDHNAYGALVRGEAVCEGYAEAFCWLADSCGLESRFVYGVYNNELHDWNMVKLGGQWYQLDITSDDTAEQNGAENGYGWGKLRNQYLNLTDSQMARDHQWQPLEKLACQAKDYGPEAVGEYLKKKRE